MEKIKTGGTRMKGRLGRPSEVHTEDEVSAVSYYGNHEDILFIFLWRQASVVVF